MVRYYTYRGIGGALQFCCRWCKDEHERTRAIEHRQRARATVFDQRLDAPDLTAPSHASR
jgi:hypothetical protein